MTGDINRSRRRGVGGRRQPRYQHQSHRIWVRRNLHESGCDASVVEEEGGGGYGVGGCDVARVTLETQEFNPGHLYLAEPKNTMLDQNGAITDRLPFAK